jgi:biotin synthase-related radical SAM superfamily protein
MLSYFEVLMVDMPAESVSEGLPRLLRISLGTAVTFKLLTGKLDARPTTAYLMTYGRGRCLSNCGFCPQARRSHSRPDLLSRVSWPVFPTREVLERIRNLAEDDMIRRVCLQALNYPMVFTHLEALISAIKQRAKIPISVSCQPLITENIRLVADAGAERIGIPLDAATQDLFEKIKGTSAGGPYSWAGQFRLLRDAVSIFGPGRVSTHLIVGLGETEQEMVRMFQRCVDIDVFPALFAFTPVPGTRLEGESQPSIEKYRRVQIARSLILHGATTVERMSFTKMGELIDFGVDEERLKQAVRSGEPFLTAGCPNCNRPYYNEKPRGPMYNFPRRLTEEELFEIKGQFGLNEA